MKRAFHSPEPISKKPSGMGSFFEWIQEIICLDNQQWSEQNENLSKFATELIHNQMSSCALYKITQFDATLDILNLLLQHYPEYHNILSTSIATVQSLVVRNQLNQSLVQEYTVSFNLLFKKKWQYTSNQYCTPLMSNHKYIDLIFNHGYNILLFIKSMYNMSVNTDSRLMYGFLACLLQNMYFHLEWTIPIPQLIEQSQFTPAELLDINKYPDHPIIALLFTKWHIKTSFIPALSQEFANLKSSIPLCSWYGDPQSSEFNAVVVQFNQQITQLALNPEFLGMDICKKPSRLLYDPCPGTRLIRQSVTIPNRTKSSFSSTTAQRSVDYSKSKSIKSNKSNPPRAIKQLLQLLPHLQFDITDIEQYSVFLSQLNENQILFQNTHNLPNFPIIGFIGILISHCNAQAIQITDKLLAICSAMLFDIWFVSSATAPVPFLQSNAYALWSVYPMEMLYCYSIVQTFNYYDQPPKQMNQSYLAHHASRNQNAFPIAIEQLFMLMKQQYLLSGIWQEPEIFNTCALMYMANNDTTSDGIRAMEICKVHDMEEMRLFYANQQSIYQLFSPSTAFDGVLDYVPSNYLDFKEFIMYVFIMVIEESLSMAECIMMNINGHHWKGVRQEAILDKLKKFTTCAILKEDRFRMLDYRDITLIITCGVFGIGKYLGIPLQLAECVGAMETSLMYFNTEECLYNIYDKTLQNNSKVYCHVVDFFNLHFVPTFGNLIRHFSRTVSFIIHLGGDARDDGESI